MNMSFSQPLLSDSSVGIQGFRGSEIWAEFTLYCSLGLCRRAGYLTALNLGLLICNLVMVTEPTLRDC